MYRIGMNPYGGLVTKTQYLRGKGSVPGTRGATTVNGHTKEFVAVKLASGTWINGTVVLIEGTANVGAAVTASGAPAISINQRVGILVFNSATATQTVGATAFGWAQIAGQCLALVSVSVTAPGIALGMGAGAGALIAQVGASASTMMHGITAIATQTNTSGLLSVMLNYPCFIGPPDTNLA